MRQRFDHSIITALRIMRHSGFDLVSEASVFFEVLCEQKAGRQPTVGDVVRLTGYPFSTVSRLCWTLHQRGLFAYEADPKDRRHKILRALEEKLAAAEKVA